MKNGSGTKAAMEKGSNSGSATTRQMNSGVDMSNCRHARYPRPRVTMSHSSARFPLASQ
ncbi:hypothetical protein [Streptomyces mirabilis]|uniref:hypothetical protein n=1 Tax=Streptomyces mirabilis TaxID=68239 RepID=UPI0015A5039A|nr:hypothetical protein [Streptomyces mirabilis]